MRYLLDTNVFIWFAMDDENIYPEHKRIIKSPDNEVVISIVSLWEIGIKYALGKIDLKGSLPELFAAVENDFQMHVLPIEQKHILKAIELPFHHRDPFDRLIYAQSLTENMAFLYTDKIFDQYQGM
jgi:PIN domain nuclease of toxin-antitoxin system